MATFSVHTGDAPDSSLTLVRDGFSLPALLLGPLWFVWTRAWLGAFLWVLGVGIVAAVGAARWVGVEAALAAALSLHMFMALEASEFRRRSLIRRGRRLADIVDARNRAEAEIRYLARRFAASNQNMSQPVPRAQGQRAEAVGLFLNGA